MSAAEFNAQLCSRIETKRRFRQQEVSVKEKTQHGGIQDLERKRKSA
jgi:hypothetical protein